MYPIVKADRRKRYIGFVINNSNQDIIRSELTDELQSKSLFLFNKDCKKLGIRLLRFNGIAGIIKCNHIEKENTIKLLKSLKKVKSKNISITTLATSGTIRSLMKKHMNNYF